MKMTKKPDSMEKTDKNVSRRDFLKVAGAMTGAAALTQVVNLGKTGSRAQGEHGEGDGPRWGMLIDINKCIGCNYCTYACQAVNNLQDEMNYSTVTTETTRTGVEFFLSRPCMHCDDAPCVHVCPVKATYLRPDGIVTMDYDLCIGCRYCEIACPYDARVFNWKKHTELSPRVPEYGVPEVPPRPRGVIEKCTFCEHRIDPGVERGLTPGVDPQATPACVIACPTIARVFGDINDPESPISKVLSETTVTIRLREELSTAPKVYYIPPQEKAAEGG
jgi:phenylacetyl-CoA:acceptor oxidoreductase 27-kDa subunit